MARPPGSRGRDYNEEPSNNRHGPKHVEPHSPWQVLVEKQRVKTQQSLRVIATRANIPSGTLFNWVRSKKGCPPRISYTQHLNKCLATALEVDEQKLADAYNSSAFKPVDPKIIEAPAHSLLQPQQNSADLVVEALKRLLDVLKSTGRTSFTLSELELSIQMLIGVSQNLGD